MDARHPDQMPHERFSKTLEHLRRRAIAQQLTPLLVERQRRGYPDREGRVTGIINMAIAARAAGHMSFERYVAIAGVMAEHLNEERWSAGAYDEELRPHSDIMREAETRERLGPESHFELGKGPADYEAANLAYEAVLDRHLKEIFAERGLHDIGELWERDKDEYRRVVEVGSRRRREVLEPRTAVAAMIDIYEREADVCERASAYYGACAMLGAAAEARLLARALQDLPDTEAARQRLPRGPDRPKRPEPANWTFDQLISVAAEAGWIGLIPDAAGDYDFIVSALLRQLREIRNYLHAGRHAYEKPQEALTQLEMMHARAAYDCLVFSLQAGELPAG